MNSHIIAYDKRDFDFNDGESLLSESPQFHKITKTYICNDIFTQNHNVIHDARDANIFSWA